MLAPRRPALAALGLLIGGMLLSGCRQYVRLEATVDPAPIECRGDLGLGDGDRLVLRPPDHCVVVSPAGEFAVQTDCLR